MTDPAGTERLDTGAREVAPSPDDHVDVAAGTEAPAEAEGTALTTDDEAQRHDTPAEPDTEAS